MEERSRTLETTLSWVSVAVGSFCLFISPFLTRDSFIFALVLGMGLALMPSGLIAIITSVTSSRVIERSIKRKIDEVGDGLRQAVERLDSATEFLDRAHTLGVRMVYPERREALRQFLEYANSYMQNRSLDERHLVVVGSSLKGVIQDDSALARQLESIIRTAAEAPRGSAVCHFLLTHPFYSRYREAQEDRPRTGIAKEILHAIAWIERARGLSANVETKVYKGTPTCFMIATSERMIINPYPYEVEAYRCFCLEVEQTERAGSVFNSFFVSHFQRPWYGEERRDDQHHRPNALDYQHYDLDGPIEPLGLRIPDARQKYGDFFVIPDFGSFYLAVNIRGLSAAISFDRKDDGSQKVLKLSKHLEVRLLNLSPGTSTPWETVGQLELDEDRNGFWHDRLDDKALSAYSMVGVFDTKNENPLSHPAEAHETLRGSPLPILWKWLVPTSALMTATAPPAVVGSGGRTVSEARVI